MARDPDGDALWARVVESVRPLAGRARPVARPIARPPKPVAPPSSAAAVVQSARRQPVGETLDGGWDRRLRRGAIVPDWTIDLHGHTLVGAHTALDRALEIALADDVRTLLVVTGKPPRKGEERRGLIRASIHDWLAHSRHAARIAAVRTAHPRHGGAGALYLILRRRRG